MKIIHKLKYLFLIYCICFCADNTEAQGNKVLIIGNSIMFYNDMPKMLETMLNEQIKPYFVRDVSKGGSSLTVSLYTYYKTEKRGIDIRTEQDSIGQASSIANILKEKWDWVILQEQNEFLLYNELFNYVTQKTLNEYGDLIKNGNPNCKILMYENYAGKNTRKHSYIVKKSFPVVLDSVQIKMVSDSIKNHLFGSYYSLQCTTDSFFSESAVQQTYYNKLKKTCAINKFLFIPTGQIHMRLRNNYPHWKMYRIAQHPSKKTSFMFACVYYEIITGKPVTETEFTGKVSKKNAKIIKEEVHNYLLEHPMEK